MPTRKTNQHVLPRVYLSSFVDPTVPSEHPSGTPYLPPIWLLPRSLHGKPRRRSPEKAFRIPNAYTLRADDPAQPRIENALARLESDYAVALAKLGTDNEVTSQDMRTLCLFAGTMFTRTPQQMAAFQGVVDKVQHFFRQMDRASTGTEDYSDQYWAGSNETGKRTVLPGAATFAALLVANGVRVLVNFTGIPFITADRPVIHNEIHIDELLTLGFPSDWLSQALPNRREFLSVLALSPTFALAACPLFKLPEFLYSPIPTEQLAFSLALMAKDNADEWIVASTARPLGWLQERVVSFEQALRRAPVDERPVLTVYTDTTRVSMPLDSVEHGHGATPINGKLSFRTADLEALRVLARAAFISELSYHSPSGEGGGMRDATVTSVAIVPEGYTVIENGPGTRL